MTEPVEFNPYLDWVDVTDPNNIPEGARVVEAADLLRYETFGVEAASKINYLDGSSIKHLIETEDGYPARSDAGPHLFIGATNPDALMSEVDAWIPLADAAPEVLTQQSAADFASLKTSILGARLRELFNTRAQTGMLAADGNNRWGLIGDSWATFGAARPGGISAGVSGNWNYTLWQGLACESKGAIRWSYRAATSFSAADGGGFHMHEVQMPQIIAAGVKYCAILGTSAAGNDVDITQNYRNIARDLRAAGIEPVFVTLPPSNTAATRQRHERVNAWIQAFAARHSIEVWDLYGALVDPTTGGFKTGTNYDAVSINNVGHKTAVDYLLPLINARHGGSVRPRLARTSVDPANRFGDGVLLAAGTAPAGLNPQFTVGAGSFGGRTYTQPAAVAGELAAGNWQRIAVGADGNGGGTAWGLGSIQRTIALASAGAVGDLMTMAFAIKTTGFTNAAAGSFSITLEFTGAAAPYNQVQFASGWKENVDGLMSDEFTIPAGTTALVFRITTAVGVNPTTVQVGSIQLTNQTAVLGTDLTVTL